MPVYIDRDTFSKWNGEVIGQQADLIKQDIASAPPLPPVDSPSPAPAPAQPAFQPPTPSDTLTQPVPRAAPGPPALTDLLAAAGLAESPSPPAGGAATGAQPGAAPASSGGIPSLDSLLQSAGLGDVGGAVGGVVSGAAQAVASAAPPPLQDLMRSAGLLDQPKPAQQPAQAAASSTPQPGGAQFGNEVNQFQLGLSDADAYAFCGPAAAIAFSRQYGRNPTAAEARQLAVTVGWSPDQGMAGIDSERALLSKMGVATRMESNGRQDAPAFSWDHVTQDAMNGNPVVLDTPGHYYYVDGARTDNGQVVYHVGQSGLELRGGREWMTAGEINAMSQSKGSVRGALYADNPQTPHPSVANTTPSAPQSATQTTAGLSGGGALSGQIGERGQQIMSGAAQAASWLGDQGQKALQAVLMTEGGLNNARGDNGQCYDGETRVLTRRGFVYFVDLVDEDELATRRSDGVIEYHLPLARQHYRYSGEMYRFKGWNINLLVTPNHNMLAVPHYELWNNGRRVNGQPRLVQAQEMGRYRYWKVPAHARWLGDLSPEPESPVDCSPATWAAFAGLWLAEGYAAPPPKRTEVVRDTLGRRHAVSSGKTTVTITQAVGDTSEPVRRIVDGIGIDHSTQYAVSSRAKWRDKEQHVFYNRALHTWLKPLGKDAKRYIPRDMLQASPEVLTALFTGLMLGDGSRHRVRYTTTSKQLAEDVAELAIKLGWGASIKLQKRGRAEHWNPVYKVNLRGEEYFDLDLSKHLEIVPEWEGDVYCATVPNHTLLVERGGKITWCANSAGPLQFYEGGQLANLAQQLGMGLEQAKQWVEQNPIEAVKWAIGTPDKPGYLGAAIQKGLQAGLQGADLATYAQRHGQVSVSPERAGQNFAAMFGGGQGVIQGATGAVQGAGQAAGQTFADLAQTGGNLAQQGAALAKGLTQPAGESPTAAVEREANQRMAALQATLNTTLQGTQQAQDQRSVQASTIGGGLAGRGAVNVTDAGGGLTPEQIAGDTTLPVSPENQSLDAQIRQPLGPAPLYQQHPSSGAADATLDAPAGAQSLGAASEMFPTWSQDARSAVLTSDIPRGPAQGTPVPPADYTNASMARPAEPPKPLWAQIGDTIGSAISQGLQPLVQAFQGTPAPATGSPAIVPEGGGYGATGLAPVEQTGPIGQAAIGAGQVAQQVQTPEADSVPLGPVGQAIGTAASAVGTALHAGQEAIRQVSPVSGAARTVAGSDEYARQYAALGGVDLEREYRDLVQRRLNGEDGLEPRIQQIGDQLNTINAQITQGQPYEAAISQAAEQNPAFPAIEAAANVGAAGLTLPLAAEGAPLAARVLAEVLQPGTNPLEVARGAFELVRGADAADPGTEQAVRAAWESFGQRWTDSAAQRERMLSQIGDPRGFLERVRDNLTSAGGAVARGAQGVLEDISRPTRAGVVGEVPAAANADRFYHGTGSDFPRPDAARFDPNGLFGPGYYVTDSPEVAGGVVSSSGIARGKGYAQQRQVVDLTPLSDTDARSVVQEAQRRVEQVLGVPLEQPLDPARYAGQPTNEAAFRLGQDLEASALQDSGGLTVHPNVADDIVSAVLPDTVGANVRAVDVPKNLNLLDVDAPVPAGLIDRVRKQVGLEGAGFDVQDHLDGLPQKPTGQDVWQAINAGGGGERDYPNAVLQALGFDGIRYEGGKRIPMADQAGQPIEHTAVVVFPESLDKLRNATAGTRGGLLPDLAGENLARQVATRAAVGGTGAGVQESQDPNATPGDVARAAAQGAVLGGARPLIGRAIPGLRIAPEVGRIAQAIGGPPGNPRSFDLNALRQLRQQQAAQAAPVVQPARAATPLDRFIGYTAANMLSGIGTAVQNTLGNFAQMATRPVITTAAGYPSDAMRDVATMAASLSDAFAAYGRTFVTGQRTGAHYQANPGSLLNPLTYPLRNLGATDEFFRTLNGNGAAAAEASRRLRENPNLTFAQVLQQHGNDIADAATNGAAQAVFEQGGGLAGWFGEWVGRGRANLLQSNDPRERGMGLILQWLMPMTRVPGVILGEGIRGLPVVNEVRGLQRTAQLAMQGDTRAARMEFSRTYLTSFANFAILSEVAQGNITGDGPTSPADKARLMEAVDKDGNAVWRPNSVRLPGGRWLDYSGLGPISLPMSSIANLVDTATDYAQKPPEQRGDMPQLAKELLNREARTIGNAWYLKGLADVLSGIKEGTIGGTASSITQLADRLVPAESLMNELRRMEDPYARDPQNVVQREESRLPFLSRTVQPRLTATTGQPEEQPRDLVATLFRGTPNGMMTPNPVATEISRLTDAGERVTVPYEQKTYAGATQTPEQQRTIREQTGDAVRLYVLNTMNQPAYAKLTDAQKADALKQAVGQAQQSTNLTLSGQVARSPHESALLQWAQTPQYAGVSSRLPPEQIARANWEIEQARSKLADYRKQYGEQAENRLRREDPTAYRLSQRDRIDKEVLDRKKKAIDKATGGALTQTADTAASGGLVGVGGTVLRP